MTKKLFAFVLIVFLVSCNFHIEKRKYFKGYHVELSKSSNAGIAKESKSDPILENPSSNSTNILVSSEAEVSLVLNDNHRKSVDKHSSSAIVVDNKSVYKHSNIIEYVKKNSSQKAQKTNNQIRTRKKKNTNDLYLYGLAAFIALAMYGLLKKFKLSALKLSNWAANNKRKTQVLIGVIQLIYAYFGISLGRRLHDVGFEFSNSATYVFSSIFALGAIALFFQKQSSKLDLIKSLLRGKLLHLLMAISSLMMITLVGNKIGQNNPTNSVTGYIMEKRQQQLMSEVQKDSPIVKIINPEKNISSRRAASEIGGYIAGTIVLGVLLIILCCALWCWALLSAGNPVAYIAAIVVTLLSALIIFACIRGIHNAKKEQKKTMKENPPVDDKPTY